ncbi:hypothetical protein QQS21_007345 [Conoideocrella luteorostrata]|uniref:Major facilitator superfamily (MFS) profile domain-containing protein n=1 Tax=Conoideocrella luteorostrata TaxID=1105319 RepID=A0AAJ0FSI5_9HYPO|nr:hypothetical protein QQS21_007345 [Conoideocrella luteorostrata]
MTAPAQTENATVFVASEPAAVQDQAVLDKLRQQGVEISSNGFLRWSKDCVQHPRNWPVFYKAYNMTLVMFLDFFISALGTVGAACRPDVQEQYGVSSTAVSVAFSTMYFCGQAVGGVIFPPYSESFGRKNLYLFSIALFGIFNIVIPTIPSLSAIFVGRFVTGFASSIPSVVAAGAVEDLFDERTRLWLVTLWLIIANLSLAVGPIFAAYVAASAAGWRWIFYISAIISAASFILLLFSRESRATQLLSKALRSSGRPDLQIENPDHVPDLSYFVRVILFRPLILLFTEPIVFITSVISGTAFALVYLFTEVMPIIYTSYQFSLSAASLAFIPIGIGFTLSLFTRIYDHRRAKQFARRGQQELSPEDKLIGFAISSPCFAIGLWWFAWTIPPACKPHWIVSMLALVPVGFAINEFDCVLVGYLTDSYTTYASSAFASLSFLRSVLSAVFPLFAHSLYRLDANVATSILAGIATIFCISPFVMIRYGEKIRGSSRFARLSVEISENAKRAFEADNLLHDQPEMRNEGKQITL